MAKFRILALTYKAFPVTLSTVREATMEALRRMGMRVVPNGAGNDGMSANILASGWRRELDVELEAQGARRTRMRVLAKEGVFFEDNSANDLVAHVTRLLEQPPYATGVGYATHAADPAALLAPDTQVTALSR